MTEEVNPFEQYNGGNFDPRSLDADGKDWFIERFEFFETALTDPTISFSRKQELTNNYYLFLGQNKISWGLDNFDDPLSVNYDFSQSLQKAYLFSSMKLKGILYTEDDHINLKSELALADLRTRYDQIKMAEDGGDLVLNLMDITNYTRNAYRISTTIGTGDLVGSDSFYADFTEDLFPDTWAESDDFATVGISDYSVQAFVDAVTDPTNPLYDRYGQFVVTMNGMESLSDAVLETIGLKVESELSDPRLGKVSPSKTIIKLVFGSIGLASNILKTPHSRMMFSIADTADGSAEFSNLYFGDDQILNDRVYSKEFYDITGIWTQVGNLLKAFDYNDTHEYSNKSIDSAFNELAFKIADSAIVDGVFDIDVFESNHNTAIVAFDKFLGPRGDDFANELGIAKLALYESAELFYYGRKQLEHFKANTGTRFNGIDMRYFGPGEMDRNYAVAGFDPETLAFVARKWGDNISPSELNGIANLLVKIGARWDPATDYSLFGSPDTSKFEPSLAALIKQYGSEEVAAMALQFENENYNAFFQKQFTPETDVLDGIESEGDSFGIPIFDTIDSGSSSEFDNSLFDYGIDDIETFSSSPFDFTSLDSIELSSSLSTGNFVELTELDYVGSFEGQSSELETADPHGASFDDHYTIHIVLDPDTGVLVESYVEDNSETIISDSYFVNIETNNLGQKYRGAAQKWANLGVLDIYASFDELLTSYNKYDLLAAYASIAANDDLFEGQVVVGNKEDFVSRGRDYVLYLKSKGDLEEVSLSPVQTAQLAALDFGYVGGHFVENLKATQTAGSIGSSIGKQLAARFAGDKLAAQLVAGAVLGALGDELGKSIVGNNYKFGFDNVALKAGSSLSASIGSLLAIALFDEITGAEGPVAELAHTLVGAIGAEAGRAAFSAIAGTGAGFSAANAGGAFATAISSYIGVIVSIHALDGNPVGAQIGTMGGAAIGTMIGTALGGPYGGMVGGIIGAFVGAILGGSFGRGPGKPTAIAFAELGFRLDEESFYAIRGIEINDGDREIAMNIAQTGTRTLNAYLSVVGGRSAEDYSETIKYGYRGEKFVGAGNKKYTTVQDLIDAESTRVFKEIKIEGGDLYMKRALSVSEAKTIEEMSKELGIAARYGAYKDNEKLFLEGLSDWARAQWDEDLDYAKNTLKLDLENESDTYERLDGGFVFDFYAERQHWEQYREDISSGHPEEEADWQEGWRTVQTWDKQKATRLLNVGGKDILMVELGIYSDTLKFTIDGKNLIIEVLNPVVPGGAPAGDYTETYKITDWDVVWNQVDTLQFASGQVFDVSTIRSENGVSFTRTADEVGVFHDAGAPVYYKDTIESSGDIIGDIENTVAGTLSGSSEDDTLLGGGGDDIYEFGRGDGKDTVLDAYWKTEEIAKTVYYNYRKTEQIIEQEDVYHATDRQAWVTQEDVFFDGAVDTYDPNETDAAETADDHSEVISYTQTTHEDGGNDTIKFGAGVTADNLKFVLTGDTLAVYLLDPNNPDASLTDLDDVMFIKDWGRTKTRIENFTFTEPGETPLTVNDVLVRLDLHDGINSVYALDLGRDGLDLVARASSGVLFDMDGDDFREQTGWVAASDGFLVWDSNSDGIINDISEMFSAYYGGGAELTGAAIDLAFLDSNNDGVLNQDDAKFNNDKLRVWVDYNQDGITDNGELKALHRYGIKEINLDDSYGNTRVDGNQYVTAGLLTQIGLTSQAVGKSYGLYMDYDHGVRTEDTVAGADGFGRLNFEDKDNILFTNDDYNPEGDSLSITADMGGFVTAGIGDDTLSVAAGEEAGFMLNGDIGDDLITGGIGDDTLVGDEGIDTLIGGDGNDILSVDKEDLVSGVVDGGAGTDTIMLQGSEAVNLDVSTFNAEVFVGGNGNDTLSTSDTLGSNLSGGRGDDYITGYTGDDRLVGDSGDDNILGGAGDDVLQGGAGNDTLTGGLGNDTLHIDSDDLQENIQAGDGWDMVVFEDLDGMTFDAALSDVEAVAGGYGDDTIYSGSSLTEEAEIYGNAGDDILVSGAGADTLDGNSGQDTASYERSSGAVHVDLENESLTGGYAEGDILTDIENLRGSSQNDTLIGDAEDNQIEGGVGADSLVGGDGIDTASYEHSLQAVNVNLSDLTLSGGDAAGDTLSGFENLVGSAKNDTLTGDSLDSGIAGGDGDDLISGLEGDDGLFGQGGADTIFGGAGNDLIEGGEGADSLDAGAGNDTLLYSSSEEGVYVNIGTGAANSGDADGDTISGFENLVGSNKADTLIGSSGDNDILGGAGSDILRGSAGEDTLDGGLGADTVSYINSAPNGVHIDLAENIAIDGHEDEDVLLNIENITGSSNADTLTGDKFNNIIEGGGGADTLDGGDGADSVSYKSSTVGVNVNLETFDVSGGHATGDIITGFENAIGSEFGDILVGDDASNEFIGNGGADTLYGGRGDDGAVGGSGADLLYGEEGNDLLAGGTGADTIYGGFDNDTLIGNGGADILFGGLGRDMFFGGVGADTLDGGEGVDTVDYSALDSAVSVDLDAGTAIISGESNFTDMLELIEGIVASDKNDTLIGDDWNNSFSGGDGDNWIDGKDGKDTISTGKGNDTIIGGDGDDTIYSGDGADTVTGGDGNDNIYTSDGDNTLSGGAGNDLIAAGDGDDSILGGLGDDDLFGGTGNDTLMGGEGNDSYYLSVGSGSDSIFDDYYKAIFDKQELTLYHAANGGEGEPTFVLQEGQFEATFDGEVRHQDGGELDVLYIGSGLSNEDLKFEFDGDDLIIAIKDHSGPTIAINDLKDKVVIQDWVNANNRIEKLRFDDGTEIALDKGVGYDRDLEKEVLKQGQIGLLGDRIDVVDGEEVEVTVNDVLIGNEYDNLIVGLKGNDTLSGGEGNDYMQGGASNDVYLYNLNDGQDVIFDDYWTRTENSYFTPNVYEEITYGGEYNQEPIVHYIDGQVEYDVVDIRQRNGGTDTIKFGAGITKAMLVYELQGNDLIIGVNSDDLENPLASSLQNNIRINDWTNPLNSIEKIEVDGSTFTVAGEVGLNTKGDGNDTLNSTFKDDTLMGGGGNDTYYFNKGFGSDVIIEEAWGATTNTTYRSYTYERYLQQVGGEQPYPYAYESFEGERRVDYIEFQRIDGGNDTVEFGSGISLGDLLFEKIGSDLYIGIRDIENTELKASEVADRILVENWSDDRQKIETIHFADGLFLSASAIDDFINSYDNTSNTVLNGTGSNDTLVSGFGNDTLKGFSGKDILFGGAGNDSLEGGGGNDSYFLYQGSGSDVIFDDYLSVSQETDNYTLYHVEANTAGGEGSEDFVTVGDQYDVSFASLPISANGGSDVIYIGSGLILSDLSLSFVGDDLVIGISDSANPDANVDHLDDKITIRNWFNPHNQIETLKFSDGSSLNLLSLINQAGNSNANTIAGGNNSNFIQGAGGADTLTGNQGNDRLEGGAGSDVYVYQVGDGQDIISDDYWTASESVQTKDHTYHKSTFGGEGALEETVLDIEGVIEYDVIENTQLNGGGADTIYFNDSAIELNDLVFEIKENDLYIGVKSVNSSGDNASDYEDHILVKNWTNVNNRVEKIKFSDNSTQTIAALINYVSGNSSNNTLISSSSDETLRGEGGNDVYHFDRNFGVDIIEDIGWGEKVTTEKKLFTYEKLVMDAGGESSHYETFEGEREVLIKSPAVANGGSDVLEFGSGISIIDIAIQKIGSDLIVGIRSLSEVGVPASLLTDRVTIKNWSKNYYKIETLRFADGSTYSLASIANNAGNEAESDSLTLNGTSSADVLISGSGNDLLKGKNGADHLIGGSGDDTLQGGGGNDNYYLYKGSGTDEIFDDYWVNVTEKDTYTIYNPTFVDGGEGNPDQLVLQSNQYEATLGNVAEQVSGGTDTLYLGEGIVQSDLLFQFDGNNLIVAIKDSGNPNANIEQLEDKVVILNWSNSNNRIEKIRFDDGSTINMPNRTAIEGTASNNVLNGTSASNVLQGHGGNDTLKGKAGDDLLEGGVGNDTYYFDIGFGKDVIFDDSGKYQKSFANEDHTYELITYGGETGQDSTSHFIDGDKEYTKLNYRQVNAGTDIIQFGAGITADDLTYEFTKNGLVIGLDRSGSGLPASQLENTITIQNWGNTYNRVETLKFSDNSTLSIASQVSNIIGTSASQTLNGTDSSDLIQGFLGNDTLNGDGGNDLLEGGGSTDTYLFDRGDGQDVIFDDYWVNTSITEDINYTYREWVGGGEDGHWEDTPAIRRVDTLGTVQSNGGNDIIQFGYGIELQDLIFDFVGNDLKIGIVDSSNPDQTIDQLENTVTVRNWKNTNNRVERLKFADGSYKNLTTWIVEGSSANNNLTGTTGADIVIGSSGNDTLVGGSGDDILNGGKGSDTLLEDSGDDILDGGVGSDTAVYIGNRSLYTISSDEGYFTVTKNSSGDVDRLANIETLAFADAEYNLSSFAGMNDISARIILNAGTLNEGQLEGPTPSLVHASEFILEEGPAGLTLNADGEFSFEATAGQSDDVDFYYSYIDESGNRSLKRATIDVQNLDFTSGVEAQVNSTTAGIQNWPSSTSLSDGGYVVVWQSGSVDFVIKGQRYGANGVAVGSEFSVTAAGGEGARVDVAAMSTGGFVLTWQSVSDPEDTEVWAQVFDDSDYAVDGTPVAGASINVSAERIDKQQYPKVAALASGRYVVTWSSNGEDGNNWGSYARILNSDGSEYLAKFQVNEAYTNKDQYLTQVSTLADGGFVITWQSTGQDGYSSGIYGQRFDVTGARIGNEFQINSEIEGIQKNSRIASLESGGFVVLWESNEQDGSGYGIFGQRFDADAARIGGEFQVNTSTENHQISSSIATMAGGGFVIVWRHYNADGSHAIFGQEFASDGSRLGDEFQINDPVDTSPHLPTVASLADGGYVVTWRSSNQDGDSYGIATKAFSSLHGTIGHDILNGTSTHDKIYGQSGNDLLIGGDGDDTLDGGTGEDIAKFAGYASDYDIQSAGAGVFTIENKTNPEEGLDTVTDVEQFEFADGIRHIGVNEAPTVSNAIADQNAIEDAVFSYDIPGNIFFDANLGDILSYSLSLVGGGEIPSWMSFAGSTLSGIPLNSDVGVHSVLVTATDGLGESAAISFDILVENVNDAPQVANVVPVLLASEDAPFSYSVPLDVFEDEDGDLLTLSAVLDNGDLLPSWLTFDGAIFTGIPLADDVGSLNIKLTASDGNETVHTLISMSVLGVNDAPTVNTSLVVDQLAPEDAPFNYVIPEGTFADEDGDQLLLSATLVDGSELPAWLSFNATTGTFSGTPLQHNIGNVEVKIIASDQFGESASDIFNIQVVNVNDAPLIYSSLDFGSLTTNQGILITAAQLLANASDEDGDVLSVSNLAMSTGSGNLVDNGDQTWTFTPSLDWAGDVAFTYEVTDGSATTNGDAILSVESANSLPTGGGNVDLGIVQETNELIVTLAQLIGLTTDPDGSILTVDNILIVNGQGDVSDNGDGTWTIIPDQNWNGELALSYEISDGEGVISGSASLIVAAVNDAPEISASVNLSTSEDVALAISEADLLANASDVDGDSLSVIGLVVNGGVGTLVDNGNGTWTYTPPADFTGDVTLDYSVSDGTESTVASATIAVAAVNDAPVTAGGTITMPGDGIAEGQLHATDEESLESSLNFSLETAPLNGIVEILSDGSYTYTPAVGYTGTDTFTYQVSDGDGGLTSGTISIDVYEADVVPAESDLLAEAATNFGSGEISLGRDPSFFNLTDMTLSVTFELNNLTSGTQALLWNHTKYGIVVENNDLAVVFQNSSSELEFLIYDNVLLDTGWHDVQVVVDSQTNNVKVYLDGAALYDGPSPDIQIGGIASWDVFAGGVFGDVLNGRVADVTILNQAVAIDGAQSIYERMVTIDSLDTVLELDPVTNDTGDHDLLGTAADNLIIGDAGNDTLTGGLGNDTLQGGDGADTAVFSGNLNDYTITFNDTNDTWSINNSSGEIDLVSNVEFFQFADQTISANSLLNSAPEVSDAVNLNTSEDVSLIITETHLLANASDVDGDSLSVTGLVVNGGVGNLVDNGDGTWTYTPPADFTGDVTLDYSVSDGTESTVASATIAVAAVNDAPEVSASVSLNTSEDVSLTISEADLLANASDVDGDSLSVTGLVVNGGVGNLVDNGDGTWTYTPPINFNGDVTLDYSVSDGSDSTMANATIAVSAENSSPVTSGGTITMPGDGTAEGQLHATDEESLEFSLNFSLETAPLNGIVTIQSDGSYIYTPAVGYTGSDSFTYQVSDGDGGLTTGTISIDVYETIDLPAESDLLADAATNFGSGEISLGRDPSFFNLTDMTLSITFELNSLTSGNQPLLWNHTKYGITVKNDDLEIAYRNSSGSVEYVTYSNAFLDTGWHDVQIVVDSQNNTLKAYVDGTVLYDGPSPDIQIGDVASWDVFAGGIFGNTLDGSIADVTILNQVVVIDGNQSVYERMVAIDEMDTVLELDETISEQMESNLLAQAATNFGSGDVNLGSDPSFFNLTDMTLSVTFELNDLATSYQALIWSHTKYTFEINQDDFTFTYRKSDGSMQVISLTNVFTEAGWHDLQIVRDSVTSQLDVWLDGNVIYSEVATDFDIGPVSFWDVTAGGAWGKDLNGRIADVSILNQAVVIDGTQSVYERMLAIDALDTVLGLDPVTTEPEDFDLSGTAIDDVIVGAAGDDTLTGGLGSDTLTGGDGADTYEFTRGDGEDVIHDISADGSTDTLNLGSINHDQLWFEQSGDDLLISIIGESDQITVDDWYISSDHKVEVIEASDGQSLDVSGVEALVNAMAIFSAPGAGETDLSDASYTDLQDDLAANWQSS